MTNVKIIRMIVADPFYSHKLAIRKLKKSKISKKYIKQNSLFGNLYKYFLRNKRNHQFGIKMKCSRTNLLQHKISNTEFSVENKQRQTYFFFTQIDLNLNYEKTREKLYNNSQEK